MADIGEDQAVVDVEVPLPPPLVLLQTSGVSLPCLLATVRALHEAYENACQGLGMDACPGDQLYALATPLFASRPPSVAAMLPLIDQVRARSNIDMRGQCVDKYLRFMPAWEEWLNTHPAVKRYLDPATVLLQPVTMAAPPSLAAIVAALPMGFPSTNPVRFFCFFFYIYIYFILFFWFVTCLHTRLLVGAVPTPVPHALLGGGGLPNMFTLPTPAAATDFATALRTHYGNGAGGGGPGAAHVIMQFSTGPLTFWD